MVFISRKHTGFNLDFPKNTDFHLEFTIKSGRRTSLGIGVISLRPRNLALGIDPGTENEVLIHFFEYQILGKWMFLASGFRATQFSGHRENPYLETVDERFSHKPAEFPSSNLAVSRNPCFNGYFCTGRSSPTNVSKFRSLKIYHSQLKIYHLVVSINGCTVRCTGVPQNLWFIMENPIQMEDFPGYPTISGHLHWVVLDHGSTISWKARGYNPLRIILDPKKQTHQTLPSVHFT